jgi:hypothetical protein
MLLVWLVHSFLKLSKAGISENFEKSPENGSAFVPQPRDYGATGSADETDESKPNSRMIKTRMMGVTLMTSVIGKKLPRRGGRPERRATDSRRQTRMTRPNLSLGRFDLSSRYFLKRSKIDISQKFEELLNR